MKWVSGGVSGPGRKLSVCSMLKEEMETLEGAGRGSHFPADEERIIVLKKRKFGLSYNFPALHHYMLLNLWSAQNISCLCTFAIHL